MTAASPPVLPSFARPPLIEVVCGVLFRQLDALLMPHFGLLWAEKYRGEYPAIREVDPLLPVVERFGEPAAEETRIVELASLPRVWFVEERENALVQVQRDRFLHNWKKVRPDDEYPRYARVVEMFFDRFRLFEDFLREHDLPGVEPRQLEMTYINHIPKGDGWQTLADVGHIFPDFAWRPGQREGGAAPSGINWMTALDLPGNIGRLRVTITNKIRKTDRLPILSLELTARGFCGDRSHESMRGWFDRIHEFMDRTFVEMTAADIRERVWGQQR